ncbi:unnamed protein product [Arctogadus glacialis]
MALLVHWQSLVICVLYRQEGITAVAHRLPHSNLAFSDASISVFWLLQRNHGDINIFKDDGYPDHLAYGACHETKEQRETHDNPDLLLYSFTTNTPVHVFRYNLGYGTCESSDWSKANYSHHLQSPTIISILIPACGPGDHHFLLYVSLINYVKNPNAMSARRLPHLPTRGLWRRDVTRVDAKREGHTVFPLREPGQMLGTVPIVIAQRSSRPPRQLLQNPLNLLCMSSKFRKEVAELMPCIRRSREWCG